MVVQYNYVRLLQFSMLFEQVMFGMADGTPYKKAYEANLEKAVANGDLTVVEFHERKNGFKFADARGVDDGSSCTKGVVEEFLNVIDASEII